MSHVKFDADGIAIAIRAILNGVVEGDTIRRQTAREADAEGAAIWIASHVLGAVATLPTIADNVGILAEQACRQADALERIAVLCDNIDFRQLNAERGHK